MLRELERDAAAGDPRASHELTRWRIKLANGRDPRKHPRPGDVVVGPPGEARTSFIGREVVNCARFLEEGGKLKAKALGPLMRRLLARCSSGACEGEVHWLRWGHGAFQRFGTLQLRSWRAWARDGRVEVAVHG